MDRFVKEFDLGDGKGYWAGGFRIFRADNSSMMPKKYSHVQA